MLYNNTVQQYIYGNHGLLNKNIKTKEFINFLATTFIKSQILNQNYCIFITTQR